jgi:uncharacterized protein (TIGR04222 family)
MGLGPFDLTGGPFLLLYGVLFLLAVLGCFALSEWLRPEGRPGKADDADELAVLAGGAPRLAEAIVARLLADHAMDITDRRELRIHRSEAVRSTAERRVMALASPATWKDVLGAIKVEAEVIEARLERKGLLMDAATRKQMRFWQTSPLFALMVFGAIKWGVGTLRDRPVGFLTALLIVTAFVALIRFAKLDAATRSGRRALGEVRRDAARLRSAPVRDEAGMAVALFGTTVLIGSGLSDFHDLRMKSTSSGDGGSGDSGSGGDGGCGGGGCGGCGG